MIRTAMLLMDADLPMGGFGLLDTGDIHFAVGKKIIFGDGSQLTTAPVAATDSVLGLVKVDGSTIVVDGNGMISATGGGGGGYTLPTSSTTILGGVKIDGTTVTIDGNGVITAHSNYTLPQATNSTLGGVFIPLAASLHTGLAISNGVPFIDVDGTTMVLDANGKLHCTVTGGGGGGVSSLNGAVGTVTLTVNGHGTNTITLTTGDLTESGNLFFTPARAISALAGQAISVGSLTSPGSGAFASLTVNGTSVLPGSYATTSQGALPLVSLTSSGTLTISNSQVNMAGTLNLGGNAVATTVQNDSRYLTLSGGTMTGNLLMGGGTNSSNISLHNIYADSFISNRIGGQGPWAVRGYASVSPSGGFGMAVLNMGTGNLDNFYAFQVHAQNGMFSHDNDLAELVLAPANDLVASDLAVIDQGDDEAVAKSAGIQYDRTVTGVVSTAPGFILGDGATGSVPMALAGRVPTKVTTKYVQQDGTVVVRPIHKGDLVVASSIAGHAMAADPSDCPNGTIPPGSIIGKAMQDWIPVDGDAQEGVIKVWVNLG